MRGMIALWEEGTATYSVSCAGDMIWYTREITDFCDWRVVSVGEAIALVKHARGEVLFDDLGWGHLNILHERILETESG